MVDREIKSGLCIMEQKKRSEEKCLEIPWQLEYYGYTPGKDEYSMSNRC
jgi:hypothetical protein